MLGRGPTTGAAPIVGGCRFPGCDNQTVDGHHIHHWLRGGPTSLDNLLSTCRRHHRLLHEGGATVEAAGDRFVWRDREGRIIEAAPPRLPAPPLPTAGIDRYQAMARRDCWSPPGSIDWPYVVDIQSSALGWV